jgi:hypothetical protein
MGKVLFHLFCFSHRYVKIIVMSIVWHKFLNNFYQYRLIASELLVDFLASFEVRIYLTLAILLDIGLWIFAYYINKLSGSDLLILHYNVDFGINLIGQPAQIFIIPTLGLIVIIINSWIAIIAGRKDNFFINLLFIAAILTILLLGMAIIMIYNINFR